MKLPHSFFALCTAISTVHAFTPVMNRECRPRFLTTRQMIAVTDGETVAESAMPTIANPYEIIGISEDELALSIDPTEFVQWIGSKQDLVEKFQQDNKEMDEERVNAEVTKFLMDAEMVRAYIQFKRDELENPSTFSEEDALSLSNPRTLATYAIWIVGGFGIGYIRKEIVEPKIASGEWELPSFMNKQVEAVDAVQNLASALRSMDTSMTVDLDHSGADSILSTVV